MHHLKTCGLLCLLSLWACTQTPEQPAAKEPVSAPDTQQQTWSLDRVSKEKLDTDLEELARLITDKILENHMD
jgi:hypothetical protein